MWGGDLGSFVNRVAVNKLFVAKFSLFFSGMRIK